MMYPSTSFTMQIANLVIEICGFDDEGSVCLDGLKRVFAQHEIGGGRTAVHRVVVCPLRQFSIPHEATLQWESAFLGVAGKRTVHRFLRFRKARTPKYSGTGNVSCYKDPVRNNTVYIVPKDAQWRVEHRADEYVTFVYSDRCYERSDGLPSMLLHLIGTQYGCYLLFASCVAFAGKGVLFAGKSGAGKSTLCLELIKQGASYIGDDLVLIYRDEGRAMVGSLLFPVKNFADGIYSHKECTDVVSQLSQRPPLNVVLKHVYMLHRVERLDMEPSTIPVSGEEMFEVMHELTNKANTCADGRHFVDTLLHVCDYVPCSMLSYSDISKLTLSFFTDND